MIRERGLSVPATSARTTEERVGRMEAKEPNHILLSDMAEIWTEPAAGGAYLMIDCCTRELVGRNLSRRYWTEDDAGSR